MPVAPTGKAAGAGASQSSGKHMRSLHSRPRYASNSALSAKLWFQRAVGWGLGGRLLAGDLALAAKLWLQRQPDYGLSNRPGIASPCTSRSRSPLLEDLRLDDLRLVAFPVLSRAGDRTRRSDSGARDAGGSSPRCPGAWRAGPAAAGGRSHGVGSARSGGERTSRVGEAGFDHLLSTRQHREGRCSRPAAVLPEGPGYCR